MTAPGTTAGTGAEGLQPRCEVATIYRGGGRRWFTLHAACRAIARQRLYARYRAAGDSLDDVDPAELAAEITRRAKLYELRFRRRRRAALASPSAPPDRAGDAPKVEGDRG